MGVIGEAYINIIAKDGGFGAGVEEDARKSGLAAGTALGGGMDAGIEGAYKDSAGRWHDANGKFVSEAEATGGMAGAGIHDGVSGGLRATEEEMEGSGSRMGGKLTGGLSKGLSVIGNVLAPGLLTPLTDSVDKASKHMDEGGTHASGFGSTIQKLGGGIALGAAAGLVAFSAIGVKMGLDFQQSTSQIAASAGISVKSANDIGNAFLSTAGTTTFGGQQMASAYAQVAAQLGTTQGRALNSGQALMVMTSASNLAEASGTDLNSATGDLAKTMQSFGINAKGAASASNILYSASKDTGLGVDTLSAQLAKLHTTLGANAPSLKDSAGLLLDLAHNGTTGRGAMTALSTGMTTLLQPTAKQAAAMKFLGVNLDDAHGKFIGMGPALNDLSNHLAVGTNAQDLQAASAIFGAKAAAQLLPTIMQGGQAFEKDAASVSKAGAAHKAAETASDNLKGQMEKLKASVGDAATKWGEVLIPILEKVISVLLKVSNFVMDHKAILIGLAVVVGGIVAVAFYTWAASLFAVDGALAPIAAAVGAISLPVLAVVAAVVALGVGIYELVKHWGTVWAEIKRLAEDAWKFITHGFDDFVHFFESLPSKVLSALSGFGSMLLGWITSAWDGVLHFVEAAFMLYINWWVLLPVKIISALMSFAPMLLGWIRSAWNAVVSFVTGALVAFVGFWMSLPSKVLSALAGFGSMLVGWIKSAWHLVVEFVTTAFQIYVQMWVFLPKKILEAVATFGPKILAWITTAWNTVVQWVTSAFSTAVAFWLNLPIRILAAVASFGSKLLSWINAAWQFVVSFVVGAFAAEVAFFAGLPGKVIAAVSGLGALLYSWIVAAWGLVTSGVEGAWQATSSFFSGIPGTILNLLGDGLSQLEQWGKDLIQGLINGVKSMAGSIGAAFKAVFNDIPGVSLLRKVPGLSFLAEGGLITKPTLAVVGESGPEMVLPLDKLSPFLTNVGPLPQFASGGSSVPPGGGSVSQLVIESGAFVVNLHGAVDPAVAAAASSGVQDGMDALTNLITKGSSPMRKATVV